MPNKEYLVDADAGFTGFDSRSNPATLKPSMLQYAENVRIEQGEARRRLGLQRLDDEALLRTVNTSPEGEEPVYVEVPLEIFAVSPYVDENGVEKILLVTDYQLLVFNPTDNLFEAYPYPLFDSTQGTSPVHIETGDECTVVQATNKIYIFRGVAERKKECVLANGNTVDPANHNVIQVTCSLHGYEEGDEIVVSDLDPSNPIESFFTTWALVSEVINPNTFRYVVTNHSGSHTGRNAIVQRAKPPLVWDGAGIQLVPQGSTAGGSANMPPSDVAVYLGNRIIVRVDRNSIAVSDYLDFNSFDLTLGQFTINQGANDRIINVTPWADDEFLCFQRNSVYIGRAESTAYVVGEEPKDTSYLKTLTTSFGAVGRKSIINTGRVVFFLSDSGIYLLEPQLDLRLINTIEPMSAPVENLIQEMNVQLVDKSVGCYFNNRMYMAIPWGADATGNNRVLIYNLINKAWESVDSYLGGTNIVDFVICNKGERKRLYAVTNYGLYLCEEVEEGDETLEYGVPLLPFDLDEDGVLLSGSEKSKIVVNAKLRSRKMLFNTAHEKRFSAVLLDVNFETKGNVETRVKIYNPDHKMPNGEGILSDKFGGLDNSDITRRVGIARRGYGVEIQIESQTGKPIFRGMAVEAMHTGRNLTSKS